MDFSNDLLKGDENRITLRLCFARGLPPERGHIKKPIGKITKGLSIWLPVQISLAFRLV